MNILNDLSKYSLCGSVKSILESIFYFEEAKNLTPYNFLSEVNYEKSYKIIYNKEGYITERSYYGKLQKFEKRVTFEYTQNFKSVNMVEYDGNNCYVSTDYFEYDWENFNYNSNCRFDKHGNVIEEPFRSKGELKTHIYDYTFDERNNWIKCIRSVNGISKVISFRKYEYYDKYLQTKDVKSVSQKKKYTIDEFRQKFGQGIRFLKINGLTNFNNLHIGSEIIFIDEPLKFEMEAGVQPDFNQCYIDVENKMYIPVYTLKKSTITNLIHNMSQKFFSEFFPNDDSYIYFVSRTHNRYENSVMVSKPNVEAKRAIKLEPNINGNEGYTVTIYNLDGNSVWGDNIQMAPKPMQVISSSKDKTILRGYGYDPIANGNPAASFANYGITIFHQDSSVEKIILHMHDKKIDMEYLSEKKSIGLEKEEIQDPEAQLKLGCEYYNVQNYEEAIKWFEKSAKQGNRDAQHNLGAYYHSILLNHSKAFFWHKMAAEKGDAESQVTLGELYYYNEGVAQDYHQAAYWYKKSAEKGNSTALFNLGGCYHSGKGVERNNAKALYYFKKAAYLGDKDAENAFAQLYLTVGLIDRFNYEDLIHE